MIEEPLAIEAVVPGIPDGLDTPCLVVDLDTVERNARRLQSELSARGVALRPHVKTHKSVRLARLQLDHGATGITVGNLGEAEVMADAEIDDIFVAYPLWGGGPKASRLRALHERVGRIAVGLDSTAAAERLAAAVEGTPRPLPVLVEVDPGNARSGVGPDVALDVARCAERLGLQVDGVFAHGGHSYWGRGAVEGAAADEVRTLADAAAALRGGGFDVRIVSAGSTPTAVLAAAGEVTEIRAGTYILGDRQQAVLGAAPPDGLALWVVATVVSTAVPGQVIIDAGAKILTKDRAEFLAGHGWLPAYPDAVIERVNDYHGVVRIPPGAATPALGETVAILPNHVCPVVDLVDRFLAVREGVALGWWPVDARGRNG